MRLTGRYKVQNLGLLQRMKIGVRIMLKIQRMSPRVGAIATGIDVRSIDERTFEKLYQAWLDCMSVILVFETS